MARLYGRAKRGTRCRSAIPHGHWKTTTFTGALRVGGMTAPMVLDGPMNGDAFRAYTEQLLAPTLVPGDIVVMDNLPAHRSPAIRADREAVADSFHREGRRVGQEMRRLPYLREGWTQPGRS